ncbi:hypothetical protein PQR02_20875 [Paraburkholderia sediminicola]|uniref:Uncharacterized protein n=1 Tax=Paraburkholderia rhynchosiae TaxID=487049 RepID=A0ACC7NBP3_9BURK
MKRQLHFFALGVVAASLPAFASTASDHIVWSAKPAAAANAQPECTAYTGRRVSDMGDASGDPVAKTLKVAGTLAAIAAIAAFSAATKAASVTGPNPCRRF